MSIKQIAAALLITVGAATAHADLETQGIPTFTGKKEVEIGYVKTFKGSKRIIVPTAFLNVTVSGEAGGFVQRGGSSAKAKSKFVVNGIDKAFAQALAQKAYDETIASFREAGWEVLTYDDIKSHEDVAGYDRMKKDAAWDMPTKKEGGNLFVVATPRDEMALDDFNRMNWKLRKVAKEREAMVYIPSYTFIAPQLWVETSRGYKSSSVGVNSAPGITLMPAGIMAYTINQKAAGGLINNREQYVHLADDAGVISEATDTSPEFANALSKTLSALGGGGWISKNSAFFGYTLNREKYEAAVLATVSNFSDVVAKKSAEYKP